MTCACRENAEGTAIVQPCVLHVRWAQAYVAQTPGPEGARVLQPKERR
jgi:hypothetical protein